MYESRDNGTNAGRGRAAVIIGIIMVVLAVVGVAAWMMMRLPGSSGGPTALLPLAGLQKEATSVELKSGYQNPFERNAQYVNPFTDYKSPFVSLQ